MSAQATPLSIRVSKASEVLKVPEDKILKCLDDMGISDDAVGLKLLEAATTTELDLDSALTGSFENETKHLQRKAAAAILKGKDPFDDKPEVKVTASDGSPHESASVAETVAKAFKESRPIEQLKDREVLEIFAEDHDAAAERVLDQRAKGQRFIVLKSKDDDTEPGDEEIDIEESLKLLKKSRRMKIPTMIPGPGNKIYHVYKLSELDMDERVVEICPICREVLFRGYCESCQINFSDVGEESRAYMYLVVDEGGIRTDSFGDRKALFASAIKGLNDLRQTWPSVEPKFRSLKLADDLPRLKMVKNLPSDRMADPFHLSGNRNF